MPWFDITTPGGKETLFHDSNLAGLLHALEKAPPAALLHFPGHSLVVGGKTTGEGVVRVGAILSVRVTEAGA